MREYTILTEGYANLLRTTNKVQKSYNNSTDITKLQEMNEKLKSENLAGKMEVKYSDLVERLSTNNYQSIIAEAARVIKRGNEIELEESIIFSEVLKTLGLNESNTELFETGRQFGLLENFDIDRDIVKYNVHGKNSAINYLSSIQLMCESARETFKKLEPETFVESGKILLAVEQLNIFYK